MRWTGRPEPGKHDITTGHSIRRCCGRGILHKCTQEEETNYSSPDPDSRVTRGVCHEMILCGCRNFTGSLISVLLLLESRMQRDKILLSRTRSEVFRDTSRRSRSLRRWGPGILCQQPMRTVNLCGGDTTVIFTSAVAIVLVKTMWIYALTAYDWLEWVRNSESDHFAIDNVAPEEELM